MSINNLDIIKTKKILIITNPEHPSGFVRGRIYEPLFQKYGLKADFIEISSAKLLKLKSKKSPLKFFFSFLYGLNRYIKKQRTLRNAINYDIIYIVKHTKSSFLKKIKEKSKGRIVFDFDDAIWLDSFFGRNEFEKRMLLCDIITCDNSYLATEAKLYNNNVFVVNGPCQVEKYQELLLKTSPNKNKDVIIVGWLGSPSTLYYLYSIYDAIEEIGKKYPHVLFKIVGSGNNKGLIPPFEKAQIQTIPFYNQEEMVREVSTFDIGIYPLFNNENSLGRGILKANIYRAGKVPTVCTSLGINKDLIQHGINGYLAKNTDEWVKVLSLLIEDEKLRNTIGENGYMNVIDNYSIEACFSQLIEVFQNI